MNKTQKIGSFVIVGAVVVVGVLYATGVFKAPMAADAMFQKVAQAQSTVTSSDVSVSLIADLTLSSANKPAQPVHVAANFDGSVTKSGDSPAEDMHVAVSESTPTSSAVSVEGDFRLVDKMLYLQATKLPPLPIDASAFTNKWISFDILALAKQAGDPALSSQLEASFNAKSTALTPQFYLDAINLAKKDGFIRSVMPAGSDTVSGVATNAYMFTFDVSKTTQFIPDYIALYNTYITKSGGTAVAVPTFTPDQKAMFSQVSVSNFKVWIGTNDNLPYKVSGTLTFNNTSVGATTGASISGTISLEETIKSYNKSAPITKPAVSVPFDQFLKTMFGASMPMVK